VTLSFAQPVETTEIGIEVWSFGQETSGGARVNVRVMTGPGRVRAVAPWVLVLVLAAAGGVRFLEPDGRAVAVSHASVSCSTAVQNASVGGAMGIEQSVAVDPTNTNNVLVGSIGSNLSSSPVVSHDCGRSWKAPTGFDTCTGDQSVAWDRHGNAYFSCDGTEVYHSSDGGDTWSAPVAAATPDDNMGDAIDRPWLVVDNSGGPRDGTVYLTWESFFTNPLGWVLERSSTDHGQTWGPVHRVDDPNGMTQQNPRNFPALDADGTLYVVYDQGINPFTLNQQNPISLIVARSSDGGVTYRRTVAASGVTRNSSPEEETELISSLAADPSPERAGHLAVAWADQRSGESRILLVDSVDGGGHWSKPVDVTDDAPGKGNEHDHPQVAFLPDGRAAIVWRDRRCCGGKYSDKYEIFARALTIDGAGTVTPGDTVPVTEAPQAPNSSSSTNEYIGVSAGPEGLNVAWDQVVGGTPQSVYRRLPLSVFPAPAANAPTAPAAAPARPAPPSRPKRKSCRRKVTLRLPVLGEHPDIDGDRDDRWRPVDAAVFVGHRSVRAVFPRHGRLPRSISLTLTGRGTVLVRITTELRRGSHTRTVSRRRRLRVCVRG
jgi:hypothetical protein